MKSKLNRLPDLCVSICVFALLAGCGSDGGAVITEAGDQTQNTLSEGEAVYRVTFEATWGADTHPVNFPSNPHFSPLTGAVHSEQSVFWQMDDFASLGIEDMAETGGTSMLLPEIESVVGEGRALAAIQGSGVQTSPGSTSVEFTVNQLNPLVTLVSMLAPSPDWFVGVNSFSLVDQDGNFIESESVDLRLYDAGTDSGTGFTSADEDTQPQVTIGLVSSAAADSDFTDGEPFVGRLIFEKIQ